MSHFYEYEQVKTRFYKLPAATTNFLAIRLVNNKDARRADFTCLEWQLTDELGRVWSTKTESWQPEVDEFAWWPPPDELEAKSLIFISSSTSLCFRCFSTCWSKMSPLEGAGIEPKDGAPAAAPGLRTKLFCLTIATLEDTVNICGMKVKCKQHKRTQITVYIQD